ncbi:MAG: L-asparaginase thermolabile family [Beijerinckiaceae bacterium]|nr:MAG: L-asparaginase thermolabile family [Beijerinckiaceae bacterium]
MSDPVLVEITRGGIVESFHHGAVAVVDADGKLVLGLGDINRPIFPRSAVKGFQALPLIESGAAERFQLTNAEIAMSCASHSGEPEHVGAAASMLGKAGLDLHCLECGAHWPMGEKAARALAAEGRTPLTLHNNCSGKHSAFLCVAVQEGHDPKGYIAPNHPLMREITASLGAMTDYNLAKTAVGVDGCSIPTFAIPLRNIAHGFARFATGQGLPPERAKAAARLRKAVAAEPFFVAGSGRFDTVVMEALRERAFIKTGAEGVYCAALPEVGLGIALKIEDGAGRAAETAMAALLARYLPLSEAEAAVVTPRTDFEMKNWNGIEVGRMRSADALRA